MLVKESVIELLIALVIYFFIISTDFFSETVIGGGDIMFNRLCSLSRHKIWLT